MIIFSLAKDVTFNFLGFFGNQGCCKKVCSPSINLVVTYLLNALSNMGCLLAANKFLDLSSSEAVSMQFYNVNIVTIENIGQYYIFYFRMPVSN